jgi:hypothetical protein
MKNLESRETLRSRVFERMEKLRIPDFIVEEFLELEVFYSIKFLEKMLTWTLYQFENWYDSHGNYRMDNY